MRHPGAVILVRHSYAPGSFDPPSARLEDCSTQRNLDESGRAQARRIGDAFRANGVTVGTVVSSPRCRCLDTARLAFGRAEAWSPLQGALNDSARRQQLVEDIKARIATHRDGPPLVLVTHGSVVSDLTGLSVRMGAIVDRSREHLGPADRAIIQARRLLLEAVKTVAEGGTPRGIEPTYTALAAAEAVLPRGTDWRDADLPAGSQIAQTV